MFEYGLLENAVDYLHEAVRRLRGSPERRDLKYATLHLGAGLELLLKERLRRDDWRQLFREPENADDGHYQRGDFISASVWQTMDRLEGVSAIAVPQRDRDRISGLREKRNRLEHFQIVDSREAVIASTGWALGFALDFIATQLGNGPPEGEGQVELNELREALPELQEFVSARRAVIARDLEDASRLVAVIECPRCFQATAVTGDGLQCLFCGYAAGINDLEQTASEWIGDVLGFSEYEIVKDGGIWPLHDCPNCDRKTLIDRGQGGELQPGERYVCLSCGNAWSERSMEQCARCGEPFDISGGMGTVCANCFEHVMGRD